jgi:hypothetical protein
VRLEDCLRHIWRNNATKGFAVARADATSGREADAERLAATIKAITGEEPRIRRKSEGAIEVICGREHLDGFKRYAELADAIEKWQEEARAPPTGRGHRAYFMAHKTGGVEDHSPRCCPHLHVAGWRAYRPGSLHHRNRRRTYALISKGLPAYNYSSPRPQ